MREGGGVSQGWEPSRQPRCTTCVARRAIYVLNETFRDDCRVATQRCATVCRSLASCLSFNLKPCGTRSYSALRATKHEVPQITLT